MLTVEDILMVKGPDVIIAAPSQSVYDAVRLMAEANVGSVIIKDGDKIEGIFTERDLLKRVVAKGIDPATTELAKVMSTSVKSCKLSDKITDVGKRLTSEHIRHITVTEQNALIGLLGLRDIMAAEHKTDKETIEQLKDQL